jgi:hypothetical protein
MTPQDFIARWKDSGGAELANSQSFLKELCHVLDVDDPEPTQSDESRNTYVFEKAVDFNNGDGTTSAGRVDLYRQGCFVLESKQGAERKSAEQLEALATKTKSKKFRTGTAQRGTPGWELAMTSARQQAKRYAEALPDEWPPFLIVADVGHCFDLYADFTQSGKNYIPFPDPRTYRIPLADLANDAIREKLQAIWRDPLAMDPSRRTAKVTREVAERLAKLAKSLEGKHTADVVAQFLMRCLFTMFAEDVQLGGFKKGDFTRFLKSRRGKLDTFVPMLQQLWQEMDTGGFSVVLEAQLKRFNGGLFEGHTALPINEDQLELLIEAAKAEWKEVEPAIFGTLLERALDPVERHKLGAHYTPRAYVERLVMPTIMEPLRNQWDIAYATAVSQYDASKATEAIKTVRRFHEQLCETRVLDPACGSGNFLYVSLELMKRLEGEVLKALRDFGDHQQVLLTIDPHQFLGIEVNPRATAIADLVLWIGYLQWHLRTRGVEDIREPIIRNFHNIECRDALLDWDDIEPVVDEEGNPITHWDGRTTKPHPVTGDEVPDEMAKVQELRYTNPRKAEWPKVDYIIGNPPFLGKLHQVRALGEGYVAALRDTYAKVVPGGADYVMYWWQKAAERVGRSAAKRFGLITTNSIRQPFNRRILADAFSAKNRVYLTEAYPDHPWVDAELGATVRIAMTVGAIGEGEGILNRIVREAPTGDGESEIVIESESGVIGESLQIGARVSSSVPLQANANVASMGPALGSRGFVITSEQRDTLVSDDGNSVASHIRPLRNGRDLLDGPRNVFAIDMTGLDESTLRSSFPATYQHLYDTVRPDRLQNRDRRLRKNWWLFRRSNELFRSMLQGLEEFVVTVETAKYRLFFMCPAEILAEHGTISFGLNDPFFFLGVLSSRVHVAWTLASGGTLEDRPRYNKTMCFEPFPFPNPDASTEKRIRTLGEQLDAHRKRQQEAHPDLTMTGMYNVLETLRAGDELTKKERDNHEKGLVSVLKQIHDDLDAAVCDAYGWPYNLVDEEILQRLVDLNHERAAEERRGIIRWLRPDFQNPGGKPATQTKLDIGETEVEPKETTPVKLKKQAWPAALPDRFNAVRVALAERGAPATPTDVAKYFTRAKKATVEEILDTLVSVGQVRQTDDGRYVT